MQTIHIPFALDSRLRAGRRASAATWALSAFIIMAPALGAAADAVWTGAENALWTNSANWSESPYPGSGTGETATFSGAGNGNTVISLEGFLGVRSVAFGSAAASYTLGTAGQTLILGSTLSADPGLASPQTVSASLQIGTDRASGTYVLTNPSPALVTFAGGIAGAASGGTAGAKSLNIGGYTLVSSVIANGGASSVSLSIRRGASYSDTVTLAAANTFSGAISVSDGCLVLKNSAALGSGSKTVTIANNVNGARPSIWLDGTGGDLDIPSAVSWSTSNAKEGALVNIAGNNTVRGSFTLQGGDGDTWLISRGGKLTLTGNFTANTATRKLGLRGDAAGEISGVIANGSTTDLPVYKNDGAGTWTLSGANTYSGYTEISAGALEVSGVGRIASSSEIRISNGATFRVRNAAAASHADRLKDTAPVKLSGGTFDFAGDGAAYTETAGTLTLVSGANAVSVAPSASLTFDNLSVTSGATVDFTLGAGARLFITGQPAGLIGTWATANGTLAYYSLTEGVIPVPSVAIAARGDTVPNALGSVVITEEGAGGPNELAAPVTTVDALVQASAYASTVNTADKTLSTRFAMIATNSAELTLGAAPNDGRLTASGNLLTLVNDSTAALTVNALIADSAGPLALLKTGSGGAVLAASNTFSGTVQVDGGHLLLKDSLALHKATLGSGGVFFDPSVATRAFTVAALTNSVPIALEDADGNPVTLTAFANAPAATFSGGLFGPGTFVKAGGGILNIDGTNSHTGVTVIEDGTVNVLNTVYALGVGSVVNDGTVNLTRGNYAYPSLTNSISGSGTFNVTLGSGSGTAVANGDASDFTGVWNVGVTQIGGKLNLSGADNAAATVNVFSNATVYVTGPVAKQAAAVLFGGKTGEQNGQLRMDAGADWAGPVFLAGDHADPGYGLIGSGSSTGTISGLIADLPGTGTHALHKQGGGQLNITHTANTYQGPTWLRSGGTGVTSLKNIGEPCSLGNPSSENAAIKIATAATASRLAYLGTGDSTDRPLDLASATGSAYIEHSGTGLLKFTAPAVLASGSGNKSLYLMGDTAGIGEIAGTIGDPSASTNTLIKQGSGTWVLSAENTFSGVTDIRGGTLSLAHPRAAAGSSLLQMTTAPGGTLSLDNNAAGEPEKDFTVGVSCPSVTLALGAGPDGLAVTHAFNDWSFSRVTVTVARAASVLSGTPAVTVHTLNLSSGTPGGDTRLRADGTDVHVGSASIRSGAYAKTLILDGDTRANTITGAVANGVATLSLQKDGSGSWTLSGTNSYTGATTVNAGGLVLAGTPSAASAVSLAGGTLVLTNAAASAAFTAALGSVVASGCATLAPVTAEAGQTAALTLADLRANEGATLDIASGAPAGASDRNRVFVTAQPEGYVGPWLTLNGSGPVMYSAALGLYLGTGFTTASLAARGDTVPNDANVSARFTAPGTSGNDTLAGASENSLAFLTQTAVSGAAATVAMPAKTLKAHGLSIEAGAAALTLGATPGEGTVTALATGGKIDLSNASDSALTVNAGTADNGAPVSLAVRGGATLAGPVAHTGRTLLNGGALTFASPFGQNLLGEIAGSGALVKNGTNTLYLAATNTFSGSVTIVDGIVRIDQDNAFGTKDGGVFISGQGTLDVGGNRAANNLALGTEQVTVSGAGYLGQGTIVNTSANDQNAAVSKLDLADDATVGGTRRWDVRNNTPVVNLNSHTLTKTGTGLLGITSATVTPGAGHIAVQQGILRLESSTKLNGGATNNLTVLSGAELELYNVSTPQGWRLVLENTSTFDAANNSTAATHNRWAGPVQLNGAATLTGGSGFVADLQGQITGSGPLTKTGSASITLSNTNNTYTGTTRIHAGTLTVPTFAALGIPADGALHFGSGTTSGSTVAYTGEGETTGRTIDLTGTTGGANIRHNGSGSLVFTHNLTVSTNGTKSIAFYTSPTGAIEFAGAIVNSPGGQSTGIQKFNSGTLTLSGANVNTGNLTVASGSLVVSGSLAMGVGQVLITSGAGSGILKIVGGGSLTGGTSDSTGAAGSSGAGGIRIGYNDINANGALWMSGGLLDRTPKGGDDNTFTVGHTANAYGYLNFSGGTLRNLRIQTCCGGISASSNTIGIVRMTGGDMHIREFIFIGRGRHTQSAFTVEGGGLWHTNTAKNLMLGYDGGRGELNLTGGTIESYGQDLTVFQRNADGYATTNAVNLCAGLLSVNAFTNYLPNLSDARLNFAGGTLKAGKDAAAFIPSNWTHVHTFGPYGAFAGGAVFDTDGKAVTVAAPIKAPSGSGVYAVALSDGGSGLIGEPYVEIAGDGAGATAIANLEDDGTSNGTYRVASVTITCPGWGYTSAPNVTFKRGGYGAVAPTVASVTLASNASGGLTKRGDGTLSLAAANTYTGATVIERGTLKLANAQALSAGTEIVLAGGTLDLGGYTVTNALTFSGGALTNGTLETVISPAGAGTVGEQALAVRNAGLTGTYLADIGAGDASDRLTVSGCLGLSGLTIQILNPEALNTARTYTLIQASGVTGKPALANAPENWHLSVGSDGSAKLIFARGTLVLMK